MATALFTLLSVFLATLPALAQESGQGQALPVEQEVYRRVGDLDLHVRVHSPGGDVSSVPSIVLVHGGGWSSGSAEDMDQWGELLAEAGWVAFSIDYRIADDSTPSWPLALEDVRAGIAWVHDNTARFGGDPERIALFGESAGAHLTMLVAMEDIGGPALSAVALWSPPLQLDELLPDPVDGVVPGCADNEPCQEFWSMGWVVRFMGCSPDECAPAYDAASPLVRSNSLDTPMWMANGTEELVPLRPVQELADRLSTMSVEHEIIAVDGPAHAHGYAAVIWNPMVVWLASQLGVDAPPPVEFPGDGSEPETAVIVIVAVVVLGLGAFVVLRVLRSSRRPQGVVGARSST